jgi:hypothetical protein
MNRTDNKNILYYFVFGWLLLNMFSAYFTELSYDEAYYWMYSRFMDWGYFDHPPMIALMNFLGYSLWAQELGVRLFSIVFSGLSILLIARMAKPANPVLLPMLVLASFPFHLTGFISIPDVPLLFFTAVFFYSYKYFLEKKSGTSALLLAVAMAALMYSKYHGILVIGFTILSNLRLVLDKKFIYAGLLALLLFVPHLYWQHTHDWLTLRFHFFDRSSRPYRFSDTWEYVVSQPLFYGPLAGFIFAYCFGKQKPTTSFERALYFTTIGIFSFFLLSTFKGSVEANWTLPALIPLTYFTLRYFDTHTTHIRWLKTAMWISLPLFLAVRWILAFPGDVYFHRMGEIAGWRSHTQEVLAIADGTPVIANSYQAASKLSFYSHRIIPSLNINGRHNQFDLWGLAYPYENKKVLFLNTHLPQNDTLLNPKSDPVFLTPIENLPVYQGLIALPVHSYEGAANDSMCIELELKSLSGTFPKNTNDVWLDYTFSSSTNPLHHHYGRSPFEQSQEPKTKGMVCVLLPETPGNYQLRLGFYSDSLGSWGTWQSKDFVVR